MSVWRSEISGRFSLATAMIAGVLLAASMAHSAPTPALSGANDPASVTRLKACRSIADSSARVACYDEAVDAFSKAEAEGHVAVVDSEKITAVRRQTFGFNFPTINFFAAGIKSQTVDNVTLTVTEAQSLDNGRWLMIADQGAAWRLTDTMQYGDPPHAGSKLEIRRGALGSFFCKIDGSPSVRCRREQ